MPRRALPPALAGVKSGHERQTHRHAGHRRRTAQFDGRRHCRQCREGARGARAGGRAGRRSRRLSRTVHRRLSAGRSGAQAGVPGRLPLGGRGIGARKPRRPGPALLLGTPWLDDGKLYNAVALLDGGAIAALRFKVDLPNYGVFDEKRVFAPGRCRGQSAFRGVRLGLPICEDIWGEEVVECLAETGAELLVVPNGSPYWRQKGDVRLNIAVARVTEQGLPAVYVNQVGAQDELVFDGVSFGLQRRLLARLPTRRLSRKRSSPRIGSGMGGTWRCEDGPNVAAVEADPRRLRGLRSRSARLRQQERLPRRGARAVRRHRLGAVRGDGGRCARSRARALHHAAVQIHRAGIARRRRRLRQGAGRALPGAADRQGGRRARRPRFRRP